MVAADAVDAVVAADAVDVVVAGVVQVVAKVVVAISRDRESLGPLADRTLTKTLPVRPSVTTDGRFSCAFLQTHRRRCQGHRRLAEKSREIR